MPITYGEPIICDFGAARLGEPGQKHSGDVMPGVYRAPEIIVGTEWDSKIDIWSVGVMVCRAALHISSTYLPLHNGYRYGTCSREGVFSMLQRMIILMMSYILPRWCRSWELRRESFWNKPISAVSTGTLKVIKTCAGDNASLVWLR